MSPATESAAQRYDRALLKTRTYRLPPDYAMPQPTSAWPAENVALLERYRDWLSSGGASRDVIDRLYIPMAGHALGLNLKPHSQLNLDADLARALDYIQAKHLSAEWTDMCRTTLDRFRRFLRLERGQREVVLRLPDVSRYQAGLPAWLIEQLERYLHLMQRNWRPARLTERIRSFWADQTLLWHWLFEHYAITGLMDIKRQYILDYVDHRLSTGHAVSGVNGDVHFFHAFLLYLQEQDYHVPQALLHLPTLKQPDRLPRFLTDEQMRCLRDEFERRVAQAQSPVQRRDALLDRAAFYLLWQGGLRLGEVEELRLQDLDLAGRKLMVRQGKGRKDRAVYITDTVVRVLEGYLAVRGMGPTDHVFLYRNLAVHKDLIHCRIKYAGERAGVKVTTHQLRHTCATQLLNAGCRVTSIQKFLGHRRLNSTMIYARVHDRTVAEDYYAAMTHIERRLDPSACSGQALSTEADAASEWVNACFARAQLRELANRLAEPQLELDARLDLVEQMRRVLQ
jgi:site-specific recombinase XerD